MNIVLYLPMEIASIVLLPLFLTIMSRGLADEHGARISRRSFPEGFIFGTASSAYQYEGGAREDGKGLSNWDKYTHSHPERIKGRTNGDIAVDQYHRYKEDVNIMKDLGLDAYRFSISWSRILPNGSLSGGINKKGVEYYNKLIDQLLSKGLQPFVTIFHSDSPQGLEEQYGGFLSPRVVKDFRDYAEVCFREFGDRVKHWITFNEPHIYSVLGYAYGITVPGRCSSWEIGNCSIGDSGREPYAVGHHQLLAHAAAANLYKNRFQKTQKGKIGITLDCDWVVPYSDSKSSGDAAARALDFKLGWFMDPLTQGDYPFTMRALVRDRLPKFTEAQSKLLKGSFDFIGLNYYSARYVDSVPISNQVNVSFITDSYIHETPERNGIPIGPKPSSERIYIYPQGIHDLLLYTKSKYNNPVIYITENGIDQIDNGTLTLDQALKDQVRIDYFQQHLFNVHKAIREGVDVRGYFAWSLLDNFEWNSGYTSRFGIHYVHFKDGFKEIPEELCSLVSEVPENVNWCL